MKKEPENKSILNVISDSSSVSTNSSNSSISRAIEIETSNSFIKLDRLYWISDIEAPKCRNTQAFYFCIDEVY